MKSKIVFETPCKLIGEDHFRAWIAPRKSAQFRALIAASLKKHPAEPLRLDVHESEAEALKAAMDKLRVGWAYAKHADALRDEAGFGRFIVWAPTRWTLPKDRAALFAAYYCADEIADVARHTCYDYSCLWPDAAAKRKHVAQARAVASKGGRAAPSNYKDADVTAAFARYHRDNPSRSVWAAANALIRPGRALQRYRRVTGLWQRVERIAQSQFGVSRDDWFANL